MERERFVSRHERCGAPTKSGHPCQKRLESCPYHDDEDRTPEYDAPESIPCPCGSGAATVRTRRITEPFTFDGNKTAIHYHYRHDGCPIGGTLVVVDGEVHRRHGPLFAPERYSTPGQPAAGD